MQRVNCRRCRYFFVTWEPSRPFGCRFFGFKSKEIPSMAVFQSSGYPCEQFSPRPTPNDQPPR